MTSIKIEDLKFSYRCFNVLNGISCDIKGGQLALLMGKNGAGKSTLFNCILKLLDGYSGKIKIDGIDLSNLNNEKLAKHISYTPQFFSNNLAYSVFDLVLMGTASSFKFYQTPSEDNKLSAMRALELLDIVKFKNRNFSHLSGGEQQLVLIARAIAQGNKILLMDEPCSSLDYGNQIKILQKLKMLAREGYLIFLTSHNPMHAYMFADNVLLLNNGVVEGYGNPKDVLKKKVIKNIFDVEVDIMNVGNKNFCVPNLRGEYDEF